VTTRQHQHKQHHKVRLVIDCSIEERAFVKMLAARKHMTISEYFLSFAKEELSGKPKIPNETTLEAHNEALNDGGTAYETMDDFWVDMGVKRRAKS